MHSREKNLHRQALRGSGSNTVEEYWNNILEAYSSLDLTLAKDKLPALSGIAKHMLSFRLGDEYLAGLWKKTIIRDLRWMVTGSHSRRPSTWRSPSWSWAAIDGLVQNNRIGNVRDYAHCIDVSVIAAGPDPTGEVLSGYIVLDAPVIPAKLGDNPNTEEAWNPSDRWSVGAAGLHLTFRADCNLDFEDGSLAVGDNVLCLRLGNGINGRDVILVLKQRGLDGIIPLYQRVGYIHHKGDVLEKYWFTSELKNMQIKII
ncbi:MAG: hypothetical protein Q9164_007790 [Protoblastenia rupestris]